MAQTILRLFSSSANAAAAVTDLKDYRFGENEVFTIDGASGSSRDDIAAHVAQTGVARDDAAIYADKVQGGATLVVVNAPFGSAHKATVLLDRHQPLPAAVATTPAPLRTPYDKSTPVSSLFQWPTLTKSASPLSDFFRWATLSTFSLSRAWGYATLSDNVAPLSKATNWPLLSEDAAPLSGKLNWRLLTNDPAPLSRRMNWSALSNNPTPLSSLLGIHVLSRHR